MHELSVAAELLSMCERRLAERGDGGAALESVRIAVGELSSVDPELLHFAWQAVVEGSRHAGATLEIRWCPARQLCASCGEVAERQPGAWLRLCPDCGQPLRIEGGDELDLLRMTAGRAVAAIAEDQR